METIHQRATRLREALVDQYLWAARLRDASARGTANIQRCTSSECIAERQGHGKCPKCTIRMVYALSSTIEEATIGMVYPRELRECMDLFPTSAERFATSWFPPTDMFVLHAVPGSVPSFTHGTLATLLHQRIVQKTWEYDQADDFREYKTVEPSSEDLLRAQRMLRYKRSCSANKACAQCGFYDEHITLQKCNYCLVTYYCGAECQRSHWRQHKRVCMRPCPLLANQDALFLPDHGCCHSYLAECPAGSMQIHIMSVHCFVTTFGYRSDQRSVFALATSGRPWPYILNVTYGPAGEVLVLTS